MVLRGRRSVLLAVLAMATLVFLWKYQNRAPLVIPIQHQQHHQQTTVTSGTTGWPVPESEWKDKNYFWSKLKVNYPLKSFQPLPDSAPRTYPKVQASFPEESESAKEKRLERQQAIKTTFLRSWKSYKKHAWMADELLPVTGGRKNPFGGWAATLVDSLDTLWIMDLRDEFNDAVTSVEKIDFTHTELGEINVFETTIRYLGGFLAAYELSNDVRLLRKAVEVGELIYKSFDTPNHLPNTRWKLHNAIKGEKQVAGSGILVAEIGSLCMEMTRLSQITGDPKWFDATQHITDLLAAQQDSTDIPGLWPLVIDAKEEIFDKGTTFTLGAMADSVYEYLPKMAAMMGGQIPIYQTMYEKAMDAATKHSFFRPITPTNEDILISGIAHTKAGKEAEFEYQGQHLVCFIGGVLAIGGRMFNRPEDVKLAGKLTDGCIYAYKAFPHGIMPELFNMAPCKKGDEECKWDEAHWKNEIVQQNKKGDAKFDPDAMISKYHLPPGFTKLPDSRYILRPEAIESVMVLYRVTGRPDLLESAWDMFKAIEKVTKTELANTAVDFVATPGGNPPKTNSMESFWMGETLKYFYLTFSSPDLISLDEFVFNTEAHPLRRLK